MFTRALYARRSGLTPLLLISWNTKNTRNRLSRAGFSVEAGDSEAAAAVDDDGALLLLEREEARGEMPATADGCDLIAADRGVGDDALGGDDDEEAGVVSLIDASPPAPVFHASLDDRDE